MGKYLILFAVILLMSLRASAQQVSLQTSPLPCTTETRDPSQPWVDDSKVLDSFPKDNPLPRFIGTFRDRKWRYMLDLYQDAKGIFGELSTGVLEADAPTSRLYDVVFDSRTGALRFSATFGAGPLQFSGTLRRQLIEAKVSQDNYTEKTTLKKLRHSANNSFFFTSRAQFDCAMMLWRRF